MKRPPTDKELLQLIYDHYYEEFGAYNEDSKSRSTKNYVPISCGAIARKLKVDEDIVFGQLYYHLDKKYGYTMDDGARVHLFAMRIGRDRHVIHFPLLSAVVAELEQSSFRFTLPIVISVLALLFSLIGVFRTLF